MPESKTDLILHPVRMRILQCLVGGQQLTTQEIKEALSDVPQATLYRHLQKLEQAEVISVVKENKIRGAVEKVYHLDQKQASVTPEEYALMGPEEHMELFTKFVSTLLGDFKRYLGQEGYDLMKDGVSFRQTTVHLTDNEFEEMITEIRTTYLKYMAYKPSKDRERRLVSTIVIPDKNKK